MVAPLQLEINDSLPDPYIVIEVGLVFRVIWHTIHFKIVTRHTSKPLAMSKQWTEKVFPSQTLKA